MDLAEHRARCLALLRERGNDGARTDELSHPSVGGHEGPRRVRELRAEGYPIRRTKLRSGYWRYWLDAEAGETQQPRLLFGTDEEAW